MSPQTQTLSAPQRAVNYNHHRVDFDWIDTATQAMHLTFANEERVHPRDMSLRIWTDAQTDLALNGDIRLVLRKGVLDTREAPTASDGWTVRVEEDAAHGTTTLTLSNPARPIVPLDVNTGELDILISGVRPRADQATHRTNVVLEANYIQGSSSGEARRIKPMLVVVLPKETAGTGAAAPVAPAAAVAVAQTWSAGFVTGNTVLNDGTHFTTLRLTVANTSMRAITSRSDTPGKITLGFGVVPAGGQNPDALLLAGSSADVTMTAGGNLVVGQQREDGHLRRVIEATASGADWSLGAGAPLDIAIKGINTALPQGFTFIDLTFSDFWHGTTPLPVETHRLLVERSPLRHGGQLLQSSLAAAEDDFDADLGLGRLWLTRSGGDSMTELTSEKLAFRKAGEAADTVNKAVLKRNADNTLDVSPGLRTNQATIEQDAAIGNNATVGRLADAKYLQADYFRVGPLWQHSSGERFTYQEWMTAIMTGNILRNGSHSRGIVTAKQIFSKRIETGRYLLSFPSRSPDGTLVGQWMLIATPCTVSDDRDNDIDNHVTLEKISTNSSIFQESWFPGPQKYEYQHFVVRGWSGKSYEDTGFVYFAWASKSSDERA